MRIDPLEYRRPATLAEALSLLQADGGPAAILGGGTDLVARLKLGILSPKVVVDVTGIPGLRYIREENGALAIGAATTLRAVATSPEVACVFPALAKAAQSVASFQIRSVGTLGGNVCLETMCWFYNQSRQWKESRPACFKAGGQLCHVVKKPGVCFATYRGDTAVALISLGAEAKIQSRGQERVIPLEDLFTGDGKTPLHLSPGEILTEVRIPLPTTASGNAFCKVSHREAVDYAQASAAVALQLEAGTHRCTNARVVLGAVETRPVRAERAEALLKGRDLTQEVFAEAADAAVSHARPMKNMTFGSPGYRRKMVRTLCLRALNAALDEARKS
jgi:4-hydroxybenzoyl-CoA reductase beta subunit